MGRTWCRLYIGTRNHRKIRLLRKLCPRTWTYWYVLIELAGEVDDEGWIYAAPGRPFTDTELARELGMHQARSWIKLRNALEMLQIVTTNEKGLLINSFTERQYEGDYSTPRVRRYREKKRMERPFQEVTETSQRQKQKQSNIPPIVPLQKGDEEGAQKKGQTDDGYDMDFDEWWKAFPNRRKKNKPGCFRKWGELRRARRLPSLKDMLSVLAAQKKSFDWTKDGGNYIPGPLPYLNQNQFLDESVVPPQSRPVIQADPSCRRCFGTGIETLPDDRARPCGCRKEMRP